MHNKNEILAFLKNNKSTLKKEYNLSKIGLFGSFARDEQTEKSDIDIILEFESETSDIYDKKAKLKQFLISRFNRNVDLCREKYIKPHIKDHVLKEAIYV